MAAHYPWSGNQPSLQNSEEILDIHGMYMETGQDAYRDLLGQKLKFVARDMLGLNMDVFLGVYPPGREREDVCGSWGDVPFDLAGVRQSERYHVFMDKYSGYPMELSVHDERPHAFHYGFAAIHDGRAASTYLHVDPCTGEITDDQTLLLGCSDPGWYHFSATEALLVRASLGSDEFCKILLEPWAEDLYRYAEKSREKMDSFKDPRDRDKARMLAKLAYGAARGQSNLFMQETHQAYLDSYGPLPAGFADLFREYEIRR